jgi:FkbM family methyltransferase
MKSFRKIADFTGCAWTLGTDLPARSALLWRQTKNLRVRLGLARHRPGECFSVRTIFGELHFRDNFGDITNLTKLLYGREYLLPRRPVSGAVLDVGSNIGMAAVWFRSLLPNEPIHCFEPLLENATMTRLNCPEAVVHQVAVGAGPGILTLDVDEDAVMASSIPWDRSAERREVPVVSLDGLVHEHGLERIAVLKIDAEGMELEVLSGAAETLRRTDQVVLETHGLERHDATVELLRQAGFTVHREEYGQATGLVFGAREPARRPASVSAAP